MENKLVDSGKWMILEASGSEALLVVVDPVSSQRSIGFRNTSSVAAMAKHEHTHSGQT